MSCRAAHEGPGWRSYDVAVFLLGVHTGTARDWGYGWLNDRYFDRRLQFLRQWEARRLDRPIPRSWRRP